MLWKFYLLPNWLSVLKRIYRVFWGPPFTINRKGHGTFMKTPIFPSPVSSRGYKIGPVCVCVCLSVCLCVNAPAFSLIYIFPLKSPNFQWFLYIFMFLCTNKWPPIQHPISFLYNPLSQYKISHRPHSDLQIINPLHFRPLLSLLVINVKSLKKLSIEFIDEIKHFVGKYFGKVYLSSWGGEFFWRGNTCLFYFNAIWHRVGTMFHYRKHAADVRVKSNTDIINITHNLL